MVAGFGPSIRVTTYSGQVLNSGFETGDFTGWTLSGDTNYIIVDDGYYTGITPHSGSYEAVLATSGSMGYISQTLQTTAGAGYLLSFWFFNGYDGPGELLVSWNGNSVLNETNPATTASPAGVHSELFTDRQINIHPGQRLSNRNFRREYVDNANGPRRWHYGWSG